MAPEITYEELEEKLRDVDIPDRELRQYFRIDEDSTPFEPIVRPDPATVEITEADEFRAEAAMAMNGVTGISRWRRQRRFKKRIKDENLPVLVSEGDSWFQFPILLDDVIDALDDRYLIWSVGKPGDTLQNMVHDKPEYMKALRKQSDHVKAFLFSGAGNDIVGEDERGKKVIPQVLKPFEAGREAAWYLETQAFEERMQFVEAAYEKVFTTVASELSDLPVIVHGYDHAIPGGFPGDPRNPIHAKRDQWIGSAFDELGIQDQNLRQQIVALMIDRLNTMQKGLCGSSGGTHANAHHVDVVGTLPDVSLWTDELHPTEPGYADVADRFHQVIAPLV